MSYNIAPELGATPHTRKDSLQFGNEFIQPQHQSQIQSEAAYIDPAILAAVSTGNDILALHPQSQYSRSHPSGPRSAFNDASYAAGRVGNSADDVARRSGDSASFAADRTGDVANRATGTVNYALNKASQDANYAANKASDNVNYAIDRGTDTANRAADSTRATANSAVEGAKSATSQAVDTASRATEQAKAATDKAANSLSNATAKVQQSASHVAVDLRQRANKITTQLENNPSVKIAQVTASKQVNSVRQQLGQSQFIRNIEARTGIDRVMLVVGGAFAYIILIPLNLFGLALPTTNILALLPACFLAARELDSNKYHADDKETKALLSYFVVLGLIHFAESLMFGFLERRIPQFYTMKLLFLAYLLHPRTQGALQIYENVFRPALQNWRAPLSTFTSPSSKSFMSATASTTFPPQSDSEKLHLPSPGSGVGIKDSAAGAHGASYGAGEAGVTQADAQIEAFNVTVQVTPKFDAEVHTDR